MCVVTVLSKPALFHRGTPAAVDGMPPESAVPVFGKE